MPAQKDTKTGKWFIQFRYTDWQGVRRKTTKRGFATKSECNDWLREFLSAKQGDLTMTFETLTEIYFNDMKTRLREHTIQNKRYIVNNKITPYFGNKTVSSIKPTDIRVWQNELINMGYAPTYLKSINNQLSTIFNYAVKFYDLRNNPCHKSGSIGKNNAEEMEFWVKEEFQKFVDCIMDKHESYIAFNVLYWTGIRVGELLALTRADINFDAKTLRIDKSYQRLNGKDVVTPPKTPKSIRTISLPEFLSEDLKEYTERLYGVTDDDRIFFFTKNFLNKEMQRGIKASGVKRIRLHDLRHSNISLLIHMGISPLAIADRVGHTGTDQIFKVYGHLFPNVQKEVSEKLSIERKDLMD